MAAKDNLALDLELGVRRWDRSRWISVFSSHNPTIREVTECLGLGLSASSSTTNRGIPKFDNPDYRKLSSDVTKLSKELPKERDALLDFAADPHSLDKELEDLLATYGPAIWSKHADRTCLLAADPAKKTYNKDLFYELPDNKEILKIHLHRWIIIKACYYIRNMKLKRPSGANEYDSLADLDGEAPSPHGTPQSLTSPERGASVGADFSVKPVNLKKRKSTAHMSLSDGEDVSPAKRAYSTLPLGRKTSPRKSLKSIYPARFASVEAIPPFLGHAHHLSPPPMAGSEAARVQLSPLSNGELNGTRRSSGTPQAPPPAGFTAVNTVALNAVNETAPVRDPSWEAARAVTKETQQASPISRDRHIHSYTSPYEPTPRKPAMDPSCSEPTSAPPVETTSPPDQGPKSADSGHVTNGVNGTSAWKSPSVQHAQETYIAPQPPSLPPPSSHSQPSGHSSAQPHVSPYGHPSAPSHAHGQSQPLTRLNSRATSPVPLAGRSIAPHPPSRSGTPLAQVVHHQPHKAPNTQAPSAPHYSTPHISSQEPSIAPRDHRAHAVPIPHASLQSHHVHQPVLKSQGSEQAHVVQAPHIVHRPMISTHDIRLLQCEVTAGLLTFFYPRSTACPDESLLLQHLHTLWYHGEPLFRPELGPHFDLISKILTAWLHERQAITALRHSLAAQPGVNPVGLVDRLLAMNDLRVMRLKWKNMSTVDGMSPEDLLCLAFRVMTNTEGSEYLFKDGLERLNGGVFEFLRSEDAKIVMQRR